MEEFIVLRFLKRNKGRLEIGFVSVKSIYLKYVLLSDSTQSL